MTRPSITAPGLEPSLRVLSLFAGIGGFDLGLQRAGGFRTVAFCEIDPFCRQVLAKNFPGVPCYDDVRTLTGERVGAIDVLVGGYPCQPFSVAGKREGVNDDRHLWPEMYRLVDELRPTWVIGENVTGHVNMGLDDVLSDLERSGYAARSFVIPAVAVDAPHRRDRVWTVAYATRDGRQGGGSADKGRYPGSTGVEQLWAELAGSGATDGTATLADAYSGDAQGVVGGRDDAQIGSFPGIRSLGLHGGAGRAKWQVEPRVGRVAYGVPRRVDRIKALGNAVVPQIPELIGRAILASISEQARAA